MGRVVTAEERARLSAWLRAHPIPQNWTPARRAKQAARMRKLQRQRFAGHTSCKRGHAYAKFGSIGTKGERNCRECRRLGSAALRAARDRTRFWPRADAIRSMRRRLERGDYLIPRVSSGVHGARHVAAFFGLPMGATIGGDSQRTIGARLAWARRRETHGPTGLTPEGRARMVAQLTGNQRRCKTHCKRGHKFRPGSFTISLRNGRQCKACAIIRAHANRLSTTRQQHRDAVLADLKRRMLAAHPDKGGTEERFIRARKNYDAERMRQHRKTSGRERRWRPIEETWAAMAHEDHV